MKTSEGAKFASLSADERHALVESLVLRHPRFTYLLSRFDACMKSFGHSAEAECLLIVGPTGAGKSTIASRYCALHPADRSSSSGPSIPVLAAPIPAPATMKSMATRLLGGLGDPLYDRGTLDNKTQRLYRLLRACGVQLLILDEFQHFIDRESDRVLATVSDWLKNLITETGIPVVLIGLPKSREVLEANEQLCRRFSAQADLSPFRLDGEFETFLDKVDQSLPFPERSGFIELADRFYRASGGVVAIVMKIVRAAAHKAIDDGKPSIDLALLSRAYRERVVSNRDQPNPFESDSTGGVLGGRQRQFVSEIPQEPMSLNQALRA